MSIKLSTEEARWGVREAAWNVEERVIWRASDASRAAIRRALRSLEPLQRLVQTKLIWPLGDRLGDYGTGARTALATAGALFALGAGYAGSRAAAGPDPVAAPLGAAAIATESAGPGATLRGVAPDFGGGSAAARAGALKVAAPPPGSAVGPEAPPEQVAWRFARAFALYEVGKLSEDSVRAFRETASPPLAKSLGTDPPRLPQGAKVPKAKVLNVVLGARRGKEIAVSASLLRLQAASELRLTLREGSGGWRVVEVLG